MRVGRDPLGLELAISKVDTLAELSQKFGGHRTQIELANSTTMKFLAVVITLLLSSTAIYAQSQLAGTFCGTVFHKETYAGYFYSQKQRILKVTYIIHITNNIISIRFLDFGIPRSFEILDGNLFEGRSFAGTISDKSIEVWDVKNVRYRDDLENQESFYMKFKKRDGNYSLYVSERTRQYDPSHSHSETIVTTNEWDAGDEGLNVANCASAE